MIPDIYITETSAAQQIRIPWIPDEIHFTSNGTRFSSYDILDRGEVKIPAGANIHGYSWEGILPGLDHFPSGAPFLRSVVDPLWVQQVWSGWREYGTPLRLLVTGTPINHEVYLEDYDVKYAGAFGDYKYSISFVDARNITIGVTAPPSAASEGAPAPTRPETQSSATSYTVQEGDTLWMVAQRFLGKSSRWPEIYEQNQAIIEQAAISYGKKSSSHGNWLFPGTKLQIPR